jgi:hypothetical protein
MASSIINSDDGVVSGTSGIKTTGGDDGVLVFQSKGTETARINTDKQIVAAAGTASLPALTTTGDVNTGIFFSAADTIDFVEGGTACGQFDSSANFKFNSGFGSVATAYGCRAWVNFDGTTNTGGNCDIRGSGNVSSVADNGTGDYTVSFTTAMPDANYAGVMGGGSTTTTRGSIVMESHIATTSSLRFQTCNANAAAIDRPVVTIHIMR